MTSKNPTAECEEQNNSRGLQDSDLGPRGLSSPRDSDVSSPPGSDPTPADIVREFFPEASDDFVEYAVWGRTGFPTFWRTDDPQAEMRRSLRRFKRATEVHCRQPLCDFCLRPALRNQWACRVHKKIMSQ